MYIALFYSVIDGSQSTSIGKPTARQHQNISTLIDVFTEGFIKISYKNMRSKTTRAQEILEEIIKKKISELFYFEDFHR